MTEEAEQGTNVVPFVRSRLQRAAAHCPHLSGVAGCQCCGFKWEAAAPVGTFWLKCPECGMNKGVFMNHVQRDAKHLTCSVCESQVFHVTLDGIYCPLCGSWCER